MEIINFLGEKIEVDCMGCDIANHKLIPQGFVVLGINKHIKSINELSVTERNKIIDILNSTIKSIKNIGLAEEVLVVQEERAQHFHIWIIPILDWMKKIGKSVRNIKEIIEYSKLNLTEEIQENMLKTIENLKKDFNKNIKPIRKAVRCFVINNNEVLITTYKKGNKKEGYYDIPGGKIENNETPKQTAIREVKEETGLKVSDLIYKGNMIIEYPNRKFDFDVFHTNTFEGQPKEFEENTSEWIEIDELLKKEKLLSNIMILDRFFIKGLINSKYNFTMHINVDENENILNVKYSLLEV